MVMRGNAPWPSLYPVVLLVLSIPQLAEAANCSRDCYPRSHCSNTTGKPECVCDCGYYGNGTSCTAYSSPVGISDVIAVPDAWMTSSSNLEKAREGRLYNGQGAWCAGKNTYGQFLQVTLNRAYLINRIATQGSPSNVTSYVTSYEILYSTDNITWKTYHHGNNSILQGNADGSSVSCNVLNSTHSTRMVARMFRIQPVSWVGHICLRVELYGEQFNKCQGACHANASCSFNTTSSAWTCICPTGFMGTGTNCTDIDECKLPNTCSPNATCLNTPGSYVCNCRGGYTGYNCTKDVDECLSQTNKCHHNAVCLNTDGSYVCRCKTGYHGDGRSCADLDECTLSNSSCHSDASCINTAGSYRCSCLQGFHGDPEVNCTDINECMAYPGVCGERSTCRNTIGAYHCECQPGYTGKHGRNCTALYILSHSSGMSSLYLGLAIGIPVALLFIFLAAIGGVLFYRSRKHSPCHRASSPRVTRSRPPSTVFGQIDQLFDDDAHKKLRDSVSLSSFKSFNIPSLHHSLVTLNNIDRTDNEKLPV